MQKQLKPATNDNPHWKNPDWKYYPACDTDIRRTLKQFAVKDPVLKKVK